MNTEPPQDDSSADHKNEMEASHKQAAAPEMPPSLSTSKSGVLQPDTNNTKNMNDNKTKCERARSMPDYDDNEKDQNPVPAAEAIPPVILSRHLDGSVARKYSRIHFWNRPFGTITVSRIRDELWCDLKGSGAISGLRWWEFIGCQRDARERLKGSSGGVRSGDSMEFPKHSAYNDLVPFEALVDIVKLTRKDEPRALESLLFIRRYMMENCTNAGESFVAKNENCWPPKGRPGPTGIMPLPWGPSLLRYYELECGEIRILLLGCHVWAHLKDAEKFTQLDENILRQIAGPKRVLSIPGYLIEDVIDTFENYTFIQLDVIQKISTAMPKEIPILEGLNRWIERDPLFPWNFMTWGGYVFANTLHKMLGPHLPFEVWLHQIRLKCQEIISRQPSSAGLDEIEFNSLIPILCARDIALSEQTFAGMVTARLLTDGGVFHGGIIGEAPDDTLLRFVDLVPDGEGCVSIPKIWEFSNTVEPYDQWYRRRLDILQSSEMLAADDRVPITSRWCEPVLNPDWDQPF